MLRSAGGNISISNNNQQQLATTASERGTERKTTDILAEGAAEPDDGDLAESPRIGFNDGIDKVRGPNGHAENMGRVDPRLAQDALDDALDAAGDIWGRGRLARGEDSARGRLAGRDIEDGGISVGPADVYAYAVHPDVCRSEGQQQQQQQRQQTNDSSDGGYQLTITLPNEGEDTASLRPCLRLYAKGAAGKGGGVQRESPRSPRGLHQQFIYQAGRA
ncbi:hypothetical protein TRV_00642 [Trichophyton verrucosum HKI 0517]|uniref:Uncharacterized protein n=1 Tax=Trichophyton verrucosum (strain HKI 0517) TaxID=663202 RepID=D4D0P7_TRIVH|nr:uncharacterized protein TRV_00642 [Trichophyton verrucosum HKI 0517]EFE44576.1 hypothetical protein TRV_00642 [Trichophyton verrucosum HKI 0517]